MLIFAAVVMIMFFGGLVSFAIRLSWGLFKFMLGLCAILLFPGIALLVLIGSLAPGWLWLTLLGIGFYRLLKPARY